MTDSYEPIIQMVQWDLNLADKWGHMLDVNPVFGYKDANSEAFSAIEYKNWEIFNTRGSKAARLLGQSS